MSSLLNLNNKTAAVIGASSGIGLVSAFARSEFQAVQFMPVVIAPQLFLCGLLVPRESMPRPLELIGDVLPMSWAVDAVTQVATETDVSAGFVHRVGFLLAFGLVALTVAALTVPRRTR